MFPILRTLNQVFSRIVTGRIGLTLGTNEVGTQTRSSYLRQFSTFDKNWFASVGIANSFRYAPTNDSVSRTLLAGDHRSPMFAQTKRDHVKFSMTKGRQKTVKAVTRRFFRLHWGGWIHTLIGRRKRLWTKNWKVRQRNRRHLICRPCHNRLFDHMVTRFWKRPKYYVDDPYEPYHVRNDFPYNVYNRRRPPT